LEGKVAELHLKDPRESRKSLSGNEKTLQHYLEVWKGVAMGKRKKEASSREAQEDKRIHRKIPDRQGRVLSGNI